MDAKDIRNLQEAYMEVVENQQLDESDDLESLQRAAQKSVNRLKKGNRITRAGAHIAAHKVARDVKKASAYGPQRPRAGQTGAYRIEQVDIYDIILSHLLDEGYAETPEAAEVIMVNMSEEWRDSIVEEFEELYEAEGSYGQTPRATAAYIARATGKGKSKTKSLALKHAVRTTADNNRDKLSAHRSKMTQSDRDYHRGQSETGGNDREGIDYDEFDTGASGPGGKPKGKKLERQRKRGISAD